LFELHSIFRPTQSAGRLQEEFGPGGEEVKRADVLVNLSSPELTDAEKAVWLSGERELFRSFLGQVLAFERGDHCQVDKLHVAPGFPEHENAPCRLNGDMIAVRNANSSSIGQMQCERMRLSGIPFE
jgi:hypothetical protein